MGESRRIAVVGTGAWGTALALMLANEGRQVSLWARSEEEALALRASHENKRFLPDVVLPESLVITSSLEQALEFIDDDELVEVTPNAIRVRKKFLKEHERKRASRAAS